MQRGWFARTFCRDEFTAHGLIGDFVQCSASFNARRGTLRGMHFQRAPHAETKLVRCTRGAVFDVLLDLRPRSATFRCWQAAELSEENGVAVYIPAGVAHGFQTLTDASEVFYQITERYVPGRLQRACAGMIRHSASTGRSGHRSCRIAMAATAIPARASGHERFRRGSAPTAPTMNVRALLDQSARVTKVRARAPLRLGFRRRRHRRLALQRHVRRLRAERDTRHVRALLDRGAQRPQGEVHRTRL